MNFITTYSKTGFLKIRNSFFWFLAILLTVSCNKPVNDYLTTGSGSGLLGIHKTDTITLNMVTEYWPHLLASQNLTLDELGTFNDPVFGRTTAGVYAQIRIETIGMPSWNSSSSMDSIVLTLKMSDTTPATGTQLAGQNWHLFKMASGFGAGTAGGTNYPSDTSFKLSLEIGHAAIRYNHADSIVTLSIKGNAINQIFKDSMFDSTRNTSLFTDPTEFDQLMHGIFIEPDSSLSGNNNGEIAPFNLQDTAHTRLTIYYDKVNFWKMNFNSTPERVNVYSHNYGNKVAWQNVGKTGKKVDRVYLQALGGMKCLVTIPYLANLVKDSMIAINQAEFIFPKVDSAADPFNTDNPPKILFRPRAYNGTDSISGFTDDLYDYFQQLYQSKTKSYNFMMTRYIQRLCFNYRNRVAKYPNLYPVYGINLSIPPDNPNSPGRALLYTQNASKKNWPKLIITYTKIVDHK